jgi:hypothetical protein
MYLIMLLGDFVLLCLCLYLYMLLVGFVYVCVYLCMIARFPVCVSLLA